MRRVDPRKPLLLSSLRKEIGRAAVLSLSGCMHGTEVMQSVHMDNQSIPQDRAAKVACVCGHHNRSRVTLAAVTVNY